MTNDPRQVIKNARARGDINQSLTVAGGSSLGAGVWRWADWEDRVEAGAPGALAASTRLVLRGLTISRSINDAALSAARTFLNGDANRRAITVLGKHGTGRSAFAIAVAKALSSEGFEEIYLVDDYLRFAQTDLADVLPPDRRSVLVVDDADVQSAFRPLYNAIGAIDVCALTTLANRRLANTYAALDSRPNKILELPGRPSN